MRNRLHVLLQVMPVLVACLLGIVTNYPTDEDNVHPYRPTALLASYGTGGRDLSPLLGRPPCCSR
ncbi:hypothetical protein [Streptomyces sp. NPDC056242]|uniref:hypothetical protein n=1 Tax=Streptomyces sp. NPDC056242 TaxID=3345760 RepID=UPI0035E2150F